MTPALLLPLLLAGVLRAETAPAEIKNPLGRNSPQISVIQFLEACHSRDYTKASHYLDLHPILPAGPQRMRPMWPVDWNNLPDDTCSIAWGISFSNGVSATRSPGFWSL